MKKFLPIFFCSALIVLFSFVFHGVVHAQPTPTPDAIYQQDAEVTFVGKTAARAKDFLNWTLRNYNWLCLKDDSSGTHQCDNTGNPLITFWIMIRNIVYAFFTFFVLVTAFIIIVTRGRSLSLPRFLPRFFAVVLLVTFSFSLLQFLYQVTDIIQYFFLRNSDGTFITTKDLLDVAFSYENFVGWRKFGPQFDESVAMTLLLTKLTAMTYYAMTGIMIIRKVILWFFIIVSPIFPVLLLYYPVRNTAKIWIGEFFRWLLYAPLFALFLRGLVVLWQNGIPLPFHFTAGQQEYPTAVNILLGGPGQQVTYTNSVNNPDTFALYAIALIMLWVVIVLPFILLQIFLNYMQNLSLQDNWVAKQLVNMNPSLLVKPHGPLPPPAPAIPPPSFSTGSAKTIEMPDISTKTPPKGIAMPLPVGSVRDSFAAPTQTPFAQTRMAADVMRLTSLPVPNMRDIARYDTMLSSKDSRSQNEVRTVRENLMRLANPAQISNVTERDRFTSMRQQLVQKSQQGNILAKTILTSADRVSNSSVERTQRETVSLEKVLQQIANPTTILSTHDREQYKEVREKLVAQSNAGNPLATTILNTANTISQTSSTSNSDVQTLQQVLSNISNPANVPAADRERYTALHDQLVTESQKGNNFARTILSSTDKSVSTTTLQQVKTQLETESKQGNTLSTSIISALNQEKSKSETVQMTQLLQSIAAPASVTSSTEKQQVEKIREQIVTASKEGNTLATSVLAVSNSMSNTTLSKSDQTTIASLMHEKVVTESTKGNTLATTLLANSTTNKAESFSTVLQYLANPASAPAEQQQQYQQIRQSLQTEQAKGNQLASEILSVSFRLTTPEVTTKDKEVISTLMQEKLTHESTNPVATALLNTRKPSTAAVPAISKMKQEILKARESKDPLALSMLNLMSQEEAATTTESAFPVVNRIQPVSFDDYESVKKMWLENYQGIESADKKATIKEDIGKIDQTMSLITSTDQEKVQEGMKEISDVLPFLLIGGFSQTEIIAYMKAKQEAAKTVLQDLEKQDTEEDTLLDVKHTKATTTQTMTISQEETVPTSGSSSPSHFSDDEDVSPLQTSTRVTSNISSATSSQSARSFPSPTILNLININLPTLKDVAKYEATTMRVENPAKIPQVAQLHQALQSIINPSIATSQIDKEHFTQVQEKLFTESKGGNPLAQSIITAAQTLSPEQKTQEIQTPALQTVLEYVSHPETAIEKEQSVYKELKENLVKESNKGNSLATSLLATTEKSKDMQAVSHLKEQLIQERIKGNPVATDFLSHMEKNVHAAPIAFPTVNRVQQVNLDDYEAVKKLWTESYQQVDIPLGKNSKPQSRKSWLLMEIEKIQYIISLLLSNDPEKIKEGMKLVMNILPFLLIGGFSQTEIVAYLKAKEEAAKTVIEKIDQKEEEENTIVDVKPTVQLKEQELATALPVDDTDKKANT